MSLDYNEMIKSAMEAVRKDERAQFAKRLAEIEASARDLVRNIDAVLHEQKLTATKAPANGQPPAKATRKRRRTEDVRVTEDQLQIADHMLRELPANSHPDGHKPTELRTAMPGWSVKRISAVLKHLVPLGRATVNNGRYKSLLAPSEQSQPQEEAFNGDAEA